MGALHTAAMMAAWIEATQQNPVVVKLQSDPDPTWKWLLPTIVQTVISLLSVGAGVRIAVWSFEKNKESEQRQWDRNQEAAREQWLRDQKKIEWHNLISELAEASKEYFPPFVNNETAWQLFNRTEQVIQRLDTATMDCIFIAEMMNISDFYLSLDQFKKELRAFSKMAQEPDSFELLSKRDRLESFYQEKSSVMFSLIVQARRMAEIDLTSSSDSAS